MTTYDYSLIKELQSSAQTLDVNGVLARVKPMPDEPRPGQLEPRELAMMEAARASGTAGFRQNMTLNDMREMMGFPNRNLNTVEIWTKYETHRFGENEVGLWFYFPRKPEGKKNRPCMIYLHGGGWVGGTTYTVENPCKLLAELADAVVVNVDYSLAPEHPYPNGFNDCYETVRYLYHHADEYGIDKERIAIAGDSAGGNLSAACALRDRDEDTHMIKLQMLIYPAVIMGGAPCRDYRFDAAAYEIAEEAKPFVLPGIMAMSGATSGNDPMTAMYLGGNVTLTQSPYVSPLWADSFQGLPRAMIVTPEFDGLRLQGEYYAKMLKEAGVPVDLIRYKGQLHAFLDKLGVIPQAEDLVIEMANAVKQM